MPNPSCLSWRALAAGIVGVSAVVLAGCTSNSTDAQDPAPSSPATVAASTTARPQATTTTAPAQAPLLVPPSTVASAPALPQYRPPEVATEPSLFEPQPPSSAAPVQPVIPVEPVLPPPSAIDSSGFPLGTTCGPVSCTSPDGLIFVNPDAIPNLNREGLDLCGQAYCPPPGFQLPSTGSGGGVAPPR